MPASGFDADSDAYYAVSRLGGSRLVLRLDRARALVRSEAFRSAQWVLWTGIAALALLLAILAVILPMPDRLHDAAGGDASRSGDAKHGCGTAASGRFGPQLGLSPAHRLFLRVGPRPCELQLIVGFR
ncbi:MAG: hypothetical protein ACREWG_12045 [Gammaproteobacteria bacterium]